MRRVSGRCSRSLITASLLALIIIGSEPTESQDSGTTAQSKLRVVNSSLAHAQRPFGPERQEDTTIYRVVVNSEGAYSIWPADREHTLGWKDIGKTGSIAECFAYIRAIWPKSASTSTASPTARRARPATINKAQTAPLSGRPQRKSLIELKPKQNETDIDVYRFTKTSESKVELMAERVTDPYTSELLTGKYLVGIGCKDGPIYIIESLFDKGTSRFCDVRCSGFGAKNGEVQLADAVPHCPQPPGTFTTSAPSSSCGSGIGDYVITISCPLYEVVTYISY